jgi:hypothetical protein
MNTITGTYELKDLKLLGPKDESQFVELFAYETVGAAIINNTHTYAWPPRRKDPEARLELENMRRQACRPTR